MDIPIETKICDKCGSHMTYTRKLSMNVTCRDITEHKFLSVYECNNCKSIQTYIDRNVLCHECGSEMESCRLNKTVSLSGIEISFTDIDAYKCKSCGEIVFPSDSVRIIQELIKGIKGGKYELLGK